MTAVTQVNPREVQPQPLREGASQHEILILVLAISALYTQCMLQFMEQNKQALLLWEQEMKARRNWTMGQGGLQMACGVLTIAAGIGGMRVEALKTVAQALPLLGNAGATLVGGVATDHEVKGQLLQQGALARSQQSEQALRAAKELLGSQVASMQEKAQAG